MLTLAHPDEPRRLPLVLAACGISRKMLAKTLGISPDYMSQLCVGRRQPSRRLARDIANLLDVAPDWLYPGLFESDEKRQP